MVSSVPSGLKKIDLTRVKKTIIVNGDDQEAEYFLNFWSEAKAAFSFDASKDKAFFLRQLVGEAQVTDFSLVYGGAVEAGALGTRLEADGQEINLSLLGEFNAVNALAAYTVGLDQSLSPIVIKTGLESIKSLAGKMEMIDAGQDFRVIVDYSFEPKAMEKLYSIIDLLPHRRIIHVLGSTGGGRDKSRRPVLGRLAGEKSSLVIVTNEDPYDEDPQQIINQVAAGAEMAGKEIGKDLLLIADRQEAINKAVELAKKDDLIIITGKGAEQAICVAHGRKIPWDDREAARIAIVDKMCIDKKT